MCLLYVLEVHHTVTYSSLSPFFPLSITVQTIFQDEAPPIIPRKKSEVKTTTCKALPNPYVKMDEHKGEALLYSLCDRFLSDWRHLQDSDDLQYFFLFLFFVFKIIRPRATCSLHIEEAVKMGHKY